MIRDVIPRLKAAVALDMPGLEDTVAVIPAPKELDPRILGWKGAGVLAKLESLNDLWVQAGDWVRSKLRSKREIH